MSVPAMDGVAASGYTPRIGQGKELPLDGVTPNQPGRRGGDLAIEFGENSRSGLETEHPSEAEEFGSAVPLDAGDLRVVRVKELVASGHRVAMALEEGADRTDTAERVADGSCGALAAYEVEDLRRGGGLGTEVSQGRSPSCGRWGVEGNTSRKYHDSVPGGRSGRVRCGGAWLPGQWSEELGRLGDAESEGSGREVSCCC